MNKNEETYLGHTTEVNYGTGSYERTILSSMSNCPPTSESDGERLGYKELLPTIEKNA